MSLSSIGFIGTGNMGSVVAKLLHRASGVEGIFLSNRSEEKAEALARDIQGTVTDNQSIAKDCQTIFLGVKPQMMAGLLAELAPIFAQRKAEDFVLVSMAAGLRISSIQEMAGGAYSVIRMMPNMPLFVGEGVVTFSATEHCPQVEEFRQWMSKGGLCQELPESQIDGATAIAGCGPAFCALFLEAMADGGVLCGLPRQDALRYAAQTMVGTGQMLLQAEMHPGLIKDGVCSPGGSTIRGVEALEQAGFRSAAIEAVKAAFLASQGLGK